MFSIVVEMIMAAWLSCFVASIWCAVAPAMVIVVAGLPGLVVVAVHFQTPAWFLIDVLIVLFIFRSSIVVGKTWGLRSGRTVDLLSSHAGGVR